MRFSGKSLKIMHCKNGKADFLRATNRRVARLRFVYWIRSNALCILQSMLSLFGIHSRPIRTEKTALRIIGCGKWIQLWDLHDRIWGFVLKTTENGREKLKSHQQHTKDGKVCLVFVAMRLVFLLARF